MNRFQVLDRKTKVFGRYFLEASAGTGKTFAIEHIAVRALLEAEPPLTIDQLLIVTFTRAATRELKVRLRSNLTKTLLFLQSKRGGPDYLQKVFERGDAAIFSAIRKIEEALCNFDAAGIFTLHGFCHKMLSDYAFEAGTFFEISPPESTSHAEKLYEVIEDYFRAGIDRHTFSPSQMEGVLKGSSTGMEGLCKKMARWMEKSLFIQKMPSFQETLEEFQKQLALLGQRGDLQSSLFARDIETLFPCYKRMYDSHKSQALHLFSLLEKKAVSYGDLDQILSAKDYFLSLLTEDNLKKGKDPKKLSLAYPFLFVEMRDSLLPLLKQAASPQKNFLRLVEGCMQRWKTSAFYEESFSPDDLLRKMVDALAKPELREKISEKYHVAIIDEFQDTDPLQWQIFKALFLSPKSLPKTIYLVGDPKQSIYAFRNADVYTYLEAMQALGEENRLFLDTNYRSEPALVRALNTLFTTSISPQWMQLPSLGKALEVRSVSAKAPFAEVEEKEKIARVHFFVAEGATGRGRRWPSEEMEEDQLFPFIVSEVLRMTKEQGCRLGQFAVLVRDRFQASRLEQFFKQWQIPCSVKRSFSLESSIAYLALHDLVRAVMAPEDIGALKKVLGGVYIGRGAHDLLGGLELEPLQKARLYFEQARELISKKGWGAFFHSFLSSKWNEGDKSLLEEMLSRKETTLYFETRQLLQILQEAPLEVLYSLERFYLYYKELAKTHPEDERLNVPSESEEDEVLVMTIHASKGLEFDYVFALGLVCRHSGKEEILRTKVEGKEILETWDPTREACIQSVLETDAEKMRHLYVALTRAKHRVYIPAAIDTDHKPVELAEASAMDLLCQSFGKQEFDLLQAYGSIHQYTAQSLHSHISALSSYASIGCTLLSKETISLSDVEGSSEEKTLSYPSVYLPLFPHRQILSFTALHPSRQKGADPLSSLIEGEEEKKADLLPLGSATGIVLHTILERILKQQMHSPYQETEILDLIYEQTEGHPVQGFEKEIAEMLKKVIHTPLIPGKEEFTFANIPSKDFYLEMEFAFTLEGSMMKGFIDGVFVFQGKYYLVDWKSNYLGEDDSFYTEEAMKQAMEAQGYFLQAAIYAEALKRYLSVVEKRSFESCFGGAFYLFLRGKKVYHFKPDLSLLLQGA